MPHSPTAEAARRRTFAIISHPDAGKTTLTEKFLLYGGAVQEAGAVKARGERRRATSDWMELEQQRGIPGDFRGVLDRRTNDFVRFTRSARGAKEAREEVVDTPRAAVEEGASWDAAQEELGLLEAVGHELDLDSFLAGVSTPVFFGSA